MNKGPKTKKFVAAAGLVTEAGIVFDPKNRIIASSTESDRSIHRAKESTVYWRGSYNY